MQTARSDKDGATARKRTPAFVVKNACVACRKRRARCDGKEPCARCVDQGEEQCRYEVSTRVSKDCMRDEIEVLKAYKDASQRVLAALVGSEGEDDEIKGKVIGALKSGSDVGEISQYLESEGGSPRLWKREDRGSHEMGATSPVTSTLESRSAARHRRGPSLRDSAKRSHHSLPDSPTAPLTRTSTFSSSRKLNDVDVSASTAQRDYTSRRYNVTEWTSVTSDLSLVENLMAFYFCWEYPIFASISKIKFVEDYFAGRRRYCSELLINAIFAVGHRFLAASENSHDLLAHKDRGREMGLKFQQEAERLLHEENGKPSITTVKALGILSILEASCGRNSQSWGYSCASIRMAVDMGLHLPSPEGTSEDDADVRSATFWGAFSLDQFWSLNVGRMPHISRKNIAVEKPHIVESEELENWGPYHNALSPLKEDQQPANARSVRQAFAGLTEIIHDSQDILYEPRDGALSQKMLAVYRKYLDWYADLPSVLRLGINSTPSVLFTHIYYHFSLVLFFRPFLKLRFHNSHIVPRDICLEAASAISVLVKSYRKLYTLRRTPCLFPYMVFAAAIIHLICGTDSPTDRNTVGIGAGVNLISNVGDAMDIDTDTQDSDKHSPDRLTVSDQVVQDIRDLNEMSACHTFARRARQIIVRMAKNWKIEPPAKRHVTLFSANSPVPCGDGSGGQDTNDNTNILNWERAMEREGVFERRPGNQDSEGQPRSTSFSFFFPDDSGDVLRQFGGAEEEDEEVDPAMEAMLSGFEARDGQPFFSPFVAQKSPEVKMKTELRGGGSPF